MHTFHILTMLYFKGLSISEYTALYKMKLFVTDIHDHGSQLEMERALLEGEHQNELDQLAQDQKKISALKQQQLQIIEQAAYKREKVLVLESEVLT